MASQLHVVNPEFAVPLKSELQIPGLTAEDDAMKTFKRFYKSTLALFQAGYRIARGLDHKTLNSYLITISRTEDIDSIIYQTSRCLWSTLNCKFFAFAVYDSEYNGGVNIWSNPETDNMAVINLVKKDFSREELYYNIRCFNSSPENKNHVLSSINYENVISYRIMDNQTLAVLYMLPGRMMLHYHTELLDIIFKTVSTSISSFINLEKLKNAAFIDPLTHCYNRRALNEHMAHDLANTERHCSDLSVIMFDMDHFKKTNDTYGHKAGDAVLQAVSKCVLSAIRKGDYLARYGGEEFILVLPETKFAKAIELAERLRKIIENLKITVCDRTINVTASFGVSVYKKGTSKNMLLHKADEMLYKSKTLGRNRISPNLRLYHKTSEKSFQTSVKKEPLLV